MPRLVGKPVNPSGPITLAILAIVLVFGSLEYVGLVDVIPEFGRPNPQATIGRSLR